ncbi:MAG: hypothetical protein LUH05_07185 [Candidatus Gastranaerophilales bacterium]|nr:hypothetical protein [Candidatus Gastranaerophilales bacterium]
MKKTFLILAIFSFVSVMPSFALKLITNDNGDRTVPSRCSGYDGQEYIYEQDYNSNSAVYKKYDGYQGDKFEAVYKPILSQHIRRELVGTTWYYPVNSPQQQSTDINSNITNQESDKLSKSYIREAADYYYVDTIENPQKPIPVGY